MNNIEQLLKKYHSEVITAAWSFFAWKSINNLAVEDRTIYDCLNSNALTWNIVTYSLQNTLFIAIGRIFDIKSEALSIHSFLNKCQEEIHQFNKESLRDRRIRENFDKEPSLNNFISDAYEPTKEDFRAIKKHVKYHQKRYEEIYRPIRNNIMAHANINTIGFEGELFSKTEVRDIQEIISFLYQVDGVITQFVTNGRKTELNDHSLNEEEFVLDDIKSLIAKLKRAR